jgi:hypothetical protein
LGAQVEEENAIRMDPLGLDRRFNRYWRVACSDDPAKVRAAVCPQV